MWSSVFLIQSAGLLLLVFWGSSCQTLQNNVTTETGHDIDWKFIGNTIYINTTYGDYDIHSVVYTSVLGDKVEVNSSILLCVGFVNITTYTREKGRTDALARVQVATASSIRTLRVFVDQACWKETKDISSCGPALKDFHAFSLDVFRYSPLGPEFWSSFRDDQLFDLNWLMNLSIHVAGGQTFPSAWVSRLTLSSLKRLEISGNHWGRVDTLLAQLPALLYLKLSGNHIEDLLEGTLMASPLLESINLSNNNMSRFPPGLDQLTSIEELDLSNQIGTDGLLISDRELSALSKMKRLYLQNTPLRGDVKKLLGLTRLQFLNLSRSSLPDTVHDFCDAKYIYLGILDLSFNNLTSLVSDIDCWLLHLREIYLQGNLFDTCVVSEWYLPDTEKLYLNRNRISRITSKSFSRLSILQLLDLSWNNITTLEMSSFRSLKNLSELYLSHNKISTIDDSIFLPPPQLNIVDISFNEVKEWPSIHGVSWYSIDFSHNQLTNIHNLRNTTKVTINLNITSNNKESLHIFISRSSIYLRKLNLSHNDFKAIPDEFVLYQSQLPDCNTDTDTTVVVSLSGNPISLISMNGVVTENVRYLDLSWNNIAHINNLIFEDLRDLKEINLSHNKISEISDKSLSHLLHLRILDISYNNLKEFSTSIVSNMSKLDVSNNSLIHINITTPIDIVNLSGNKIEELRVYKVNHLNLSYNSLTAITEPLRNILLDLVTLDIGGNDFRCCDDNGTLTHNTLMEIQHIIRNINTTQPFTTCYLNEQEPKFSLNNTWNNKNFCAEKSKEQIWNIGFTIGVPVGTVLVVVPFVSLIMGYMYYHRAELAFMKHLKRTRTRGLREDDARSGQCLYDAFVCHSSKDFKWVKNHLIPNMEKGPEGYRFCVHCRDFPLGSRIDENIQHSLEKSRKVICVLSEAFLKSEWCEIELNLAKHKMVREKRNYIILIELERVVKGDLSQNLQYLMESRTYLEWPEDEVDEFGAQRCWERLREALGDSLKQRRCHATPTPEQVTSKGSDHRFSYIGA